MLLRASAPPRLVGSTGGLAGARFSFQLGQNQKNPRGFSAHRFRVYGMPRAASNVITLPDAAFDALVAEREMFRRFLAQRVGSAADAEDILQESLLRALRHGGNLRRGERAVAWFYCILRRALADHFRRKRATARRHERLAHELDAAGENIDATSARDLDAAVCACFEGVLPTLSPRHATLLRRVDLRGESRPLVARELGLSSATLDVTLHRARTALRRRLEILCGACSRESCLACDCRPAPARVAPPLRHAGKTGGCSDATYLSPIGHAHDNPRKRCKVARRAPSARL
jgi:RNA polymerase sigma-70 factor (ECF subfamily)